MKKLSLIIALYFIVSFVVAQEIQSFSLQQAQAYALENNYEKVNAENDLLIAKKKVWETTGIGLPQVNFEAQFQNFIDLPVNLVPANAFDPNAPADEFSELKFGTDYNTSATISASQLLFDGSYIVGLQASKTYKQYAEQNVAKNRNRSKRGCSTSLLYGFGCPRK